MAFTTLWAIALMAPLVALLLILNSTGAWQPVFSLDQVVEPLITAYFLAGFLEELLKYNAIRGVLWKDLVADPRALLVYACGAANGFALIENLLYVFGSGTVTGILRAFLSVPAHTAWGMISGSMLAERKFLGVKNDWYTIVPLPCVLHGTYNFALFSVALLPPGSPAAYAGLLTAVSPLVTLFSLGYVYWQSRKFKDVPFVEVRSLQRAGLLPQATVSSCIGDCVACTPCGSSLNATQGRSMRAQSMARLETDFRTAQAPQASDPETGAPGSSTDYRGAHHPGGPPNNDRIMFVTVPDNFQPGHRLKVVGPLDQREYLIELPPNTRPGTQVLVPY
mmetsp:Transcript_26538/g.78081  ORF Transcript_26538/g.78081 Transcript_26538/m.78081 type:complete len:336 (+) Transcript_26538:202-1209(+)